MQKCCACDTLANHHVSTIRGDTVHYCWECYSDWVCQRRGLDSSRYKHPERVKVRGKTFSVHYDVFAEYMVYTALEDASNGYRAFSCQVPFETDGVEATTRLCAVIREGLKHPSLDKQHGTLEEEGFMDIWYDDEDPNKIVFVIDGKVHSSHDLMMLLEQREGWRLAFQFSHSVPHPDSQWFTSEEHIPEGDLKR